MQVAYRAGYDRNGCGPVLGFLVAWFLIVVSWWDRFHPTPHERAWSTGGLAALWGATAYFVILPAAVLCGVFCYLGFMRLLRLVGIRKTPANHPPRPSPEELERREEEARKRQREREEAERQRALEEERRAREWWNNYHRHRRVDELSGMDPLDFELFIQSLYEKAGCQDLKTTPRNGDQGADLIGTSPDGRNLVIQTKRWRGRVGNGAIQEVLGAMLYYSAEMAIVVTNNGFTGSARELASKDPRIELVDREQLACLIDAHMPKEPPPFTWVGYRALEARLAPRPRATKPPRPRAPTPPHCGRWPGRD
jgi:hypothetical protein